MNIILVALSSLLLVFNVCSNSRVVAQMQPQHSWAAKWHRTGSFDFFSSKLLDSSKQAALIICPVPVYSFLRYSQAHMPTAQYLPGCYALQVEGRLPSDIVHYLRSRKIPFRNQQHYE
jgi:hypothetical protein